MTDVAVSVKEGMFGDVLAGAKGTGAEVIAADPKLGRIYLRIDRARKPSQRARRAIKELEGMDGVKRAELIERHLKAKDAQLGEALATNRCRIILDIDSTITRGKPGTIHPSVPPILQKMKDKGIWVYAATGRSIEDLYEIINANPFQRKSIAENGGIILGLGQKGYLEFGDKTEPNKVLRYLQDKYRSREDMDQGERITEVIFLKSDVTEEMVREAREATGAKVGVHASKNALHVSKEGIDKGSAVLELGNRLKWGDAYTIAMGDSQMDVPMFRAVRHSFAPANCDAAAREGCSQVLDGRFEKALEILYEKIEGSR